MLAMYDETA